MTSNPNTRLTSFHSLPILSLLLLLLLVASPQYSLALDPDGTLLLAFKYSILSDPLSVLSTWNYDDQTPCTWTGVSCDPAGSRVTGLALPNSQLLGSIAPELGLIPHLQHLDLSSNSFNGSLPTTLFNTTQLQTLSLANNLISGQIERPPPLTTNGLNYLNLSRNALSGPVPQNLTGFANLTVLDLSSNLFNGSLASDPGPPRLHYFNLSNNRLSGDIPLDFSTALPENATVDLAFNNFTGEIPPTKVLLAQKPEYFAGNPDICGRPTKNLCVIPSSLSSRPNATASLSPAIAVIPKSVNNDSDNSSSIPPALRENAHTGLKPMTIVGITVADLAGIALLGLALLYLYQLKKKKSEENRTTADKTATEPPPPLAATKSVDYGKRFGLEQIQTHQMSLKFDTSPSPASATRACCCIKGRGGSGGDASSSSEAESEGRTSSGGAEECGGGEGRLVMVDGETEMEMETLLKASAYILGATGISIVYKAVLQSGAAFAVRRIGDGVGGEKIRRENFESQVRALGKLRHPNVVRVRGFFWGCDEKLIISDYVSNGSLATLSVYKKVGSSSPANLPLQVRLKIARGVARGVVYIHEKKFLHGNLKPSNILLTPDMEPVITDLGINWILQANKGEASWSSGRHFGSKRSMGLLEGSDVSVSSGSPYIGPSGCYNGPTTPYQAPEVMKNLKPTPKWDVYSFGILLLELLTGKVFLDHELGQWTPGSARTDDKYLALRMADPSIRADMHGKEEVMAGVFRLGFQCANLAPQRRPSMKEVLQFLDKIPIPSPQ